MKASIEEQLKNFIGDLNCIAELQGMEFEESAMRTVYANTFADIQVVLWRYNVHTTAINESKVMGIFFYHFITQRPLKNPLRKEADVWELYISNLLRVKKQSAVSTMPFFKTLKHYLSARPISPEALYLLHNMFIDLIFSFDKPKRSTGMFSSSS